MRWMVVVLVGCGRAGSNGQDGGAGAVGPRGPAGADGAPGATGGGYRWVDATGEAVTVGPDLVFVDEAGMFWGVDAETAELTAHQEDGQLYTTTDCTGPGYAILQMGVSPSVARVSPRMVVEIDGDTFVRGDTQMPQDVCFRSSDYSGSCEDLGFEACDDMFAVDDMIEVERPSVSWTGPLHPEAITP